MCAMFGCDVAAVVVVQASGVSRLAADDRTGRATLPHTSARRSASVLATVRLVSLSLVCLPHLLDPCRACRSPARAWTLDLHSPSSPHSARLTYIARRHVHCVLNPCPSSYNDSRGRRARLTRSRTAGHDMRGAVSRKRLAGPALLFPGWLCRQSPSALASRDHYRATIRDVCNSDTHRQKHIQQFVCPPRESL